MDRSPALFLATNFTGVAYQDWAVLLEGSTTDSSPWLVAAADSALHGLLEKLWHLPAAQGSSPGR